MKKIMTAAALLSCALMITACSNGGNNANTNKAESPKYDTTKTAMTVGNSKITSGVYGFYFNNLTKQGATAEQAKEAATEQCGDNYLIIEVAKGKGITFDDEKLKEISSYKKEVVDSYNGKYEDFLKENGITDENIDDIISVSYYGEALKNMAGTKEYTDAEKREYFKNHFRRAKHILISSDGMKDEDAKKMAEDLLQRAKSGEDFDKMIEDNSNDPGSKSNPDGYVFTDHEMVSEFQDGVDSIGVGEFTLVKSSYGYHIIQRLALDETPEYFEKAYAEKAERIATLIDTNSFEDQVRAWARELGIETKTDDKVIDEIVKNAAPTPTPKPTATAK